MTGGLAAAVAALLAWVGVAAPAAATSSAPGLDYVALGDSYSSGLAAGRYDPASGECFRSARAYPVLWAAENAPTSFAFVACSGASTGDVRATQLGALSAGTDLVSLTAGGNDAGFAPVLAACLVGPDDACRGALDAAQGLIDAWLPWALHGLYADVRRAAPNAQVVVLGYPRLFASPSPGAVGGISPAEQERMNALATRLNAVTAREAARAGFTFVDVEDDFAGHAVGDRRPWLTGPTWPLNESFHPTRAGHSKGYLPALSGAVTALRATA